MNFKSALFSTLQLEVVSAVIETATCAVTAYGLARFKFPGKRLVMAMLVFLIVVPSQMLVIPMTVNFSQLDFLGILKLLGKITGRELRHYNGICFIPCMALERLLSRGYVYQRKFSVGSIAGITSAEAVFARHLAGEYFEYNRCYGRMCYVCNTYSVILFDFAAQIHKEY